MSLENGKNRSWRETLVACTHPKVLAMLFLGFSSGLPLYLIFSSLSAWLTQAGVSKASVTFFSWAALGYSFKFIWAPLVDLLPLPFLTRLLGRRRGWLLLSQVLVAVAIMWMGMTNPVGSSGGLTVMALAAVMLGFSAATQDIVIDAYRIESSIESMQALLASTYIAGYRIGMLVSGAGSLYLAGWLGSSKGLYVYSAWKYTYLIMGVIMLTGIITTLCISEPGQSKERKYSDYSTEQYLRIVLLFAAATVTFALAFFFSGSISDELKKLVEDHFPVAGVLVGLGVEILRFLSAVLIAGFVCRLLVQLKLVAWEMVHQVYVRPVLDFFTRYEVKAAVLLLMLIGCYRISDVVMGVVANVFYLELGFSTIDIANISKTFGLLMTIAGGFLGGVLTVRYGVIKILFLGALLSAATNLLFMTLAKAGANLSLLTVVIMADNLSGGIATTAFVAFLSSLTSVSFTAMQYAIFSSVMLLFPKTIGGYSGTIAENFGYETFFLITACMGIPVLLLVWLVRDYVDKGKESTES